MHEELDDKMREHLGYCKANRKKAQEFAWDHWLRTVSNKSYSVCCTKPTTLGKHGKGLMLYFMFIKFMAIGFTIVTLLSVPALVSNILGKQIDSWTSVSIFDRTTLGD